MKSPFTKYYPNFNTKHWNDKEVKFQTIKIWFQVAASNAKLALFYDWLFFDPEKDNIMNIEPAILVMHHSMKPHPAITATLLDFLCRIVGNFYPKEYERVRAGIYNSLRQVIVLLKMFVIVVNITHYLLNRPTWT